MSFKTNDCQQLSFDDSFITLTERERKALEKSWAKIFADEIFPAIDEERFSVLYSDKASRPNAPVNVIIGALIIKELFDPGISLKVILDILRCFLPRDTQILAQSERTDSIHNPEIYSLGIPPLQICHFIKRRMEHLGSSHPMNILRLTVGFDQMLIAGAVGQDPQFDLRIIRIHKHKAVLWYKYLTDQSPQLHSHRNIL